jgi:zinc protease|tara:strand:+ start:1263 stop:4154 length:2892 start_codon:yes stop_codon:yes gene_type:complete
MRIGFLATVTSLALSFTALTACTDDTSVDPQKTTAEDAAVVSPPAGMRLIEEVKGEAGKTVIPYKKYELNNGLTLILHEDHSDPLVHVDVTYHVGSAREEAGKSGFAHFFEHMMFQGSENVADEEHFKIVTEAGGNMNGTTSTDRTNYFQTVPANQLEKVLWLEADRMGFLLDAVTQEKFEVQRDTVKNERDERVDNRPYGRLYERVSEALYPEGHPYSWPTIGFVEDLDRANVNDLKEFFLRWYGPNNATLTIGGDLDVGRTLTMVDRYFSTIPRGPDIPAPEKVRVTLSEDRYISMEDNVYLPMLFMAYPTVSVHHPDEAPLDLLSEILGGSKTSLLYKNLVKNQIAVQAQVGHPCTELACTFSLLALPHPASGKSLADLEAIIRSSIDEFEERGVQDDDLIKAKAKMEALFVFGLQSVRGKVSQLASNQTFTGNPNFIEQDIARYNGVTEEDVIRVFNKYIKGQKGVIMSIVPNGQLASIAHKDTFERPARLFDATSTTSAADLAMRVAQDDFDRSKQPDAGKSAEAQLPAFWRHEMKNGISILGSQSTETPTSAILLKIPGGHYHESKDKAGTASMLAALLNESTRRRSTEEMSNELQKLGASISISVQNLYVTVFVSSLTKNLDATLALVQEKLFEPAFLKEDYVRVHQQTLQGILNNKKDAGYLASTAYRALLYGDNIAGLPGGGNETTLQSVTLDDVKGFYDTNLKPSGAQLIVVSDLQQAPLIASIDKVLGGWKGEGRKLELTLPVPSHEVNTVYLVNKDEAVQSAIRIGKRDLKQDITGEYYRSGLMNFPLGGHFNSRINLNLREEKGYTYGARSFFSGGKLAGSYTASASVRADVTDKSIAEFVSEIKRYHDKGISADELVFLRKSINQRDALRYETPNAKLGFLAQILEHDLTPEFVKERAQIVDSITAEEISQLAKQHLDLDDMFIVVVGDAKTLKPKLQALGYKVKDFEV